MKWADREQVQAARTALAELSAYDTDHEDDTFDRLNTAAARTQEPLNAWQRFVLYQRWDSWVFLAVMGAGLVLAIVKLVTGP